jgi:hypothetical protein
MIGIARGTPYVAHVDGKHEASDTGSERCVDEPERTNGVVLEVQPRLAQ